MSSITPASGTQLGTPIDAARPLAHPSARGNIDQIAIPLSAGTSSINPTVYTRDLNVPGTGIGVETPRRMPGDVGDQFYRPVAGDPLGQPFTRDGRPLREAGVSEPLNSTGSSPRPSRGPAPVNSQSPGGNAAAPRTASPGRGVDPRRSAAALGGLSNGVAGVGVALATPGGAFERIGSGLGSAIGGFAGGQIGGTLGGIATAGTGAVSVPGVGLIPGAVVGYALGAGAGTIGGGYAGQRIGSGLGRSIDNAIPDFPLPWPFNGDREQYPNQLDPAALGQGPQTDVGSPGTTAVGSVAGAAYRLRVFGGTIYGPSGVPSSGDVQIIPGFIGPLNVVGPYDAFPFGVYQRVVSVDGAEPGGAVTPFLEENWNDGSPKIRGRQYAIERADGGTDPTVGGIPPTFAPNPARTAPPADPAAPWDVPGQLAPPPVPYAPTPSPDNPLPWPLVAPLPPVFPGLTPDPSPPTRTAPRTASPTAPAPDPGFQPAPDDLGTAPNAPPTPARPPAGRPTLSPDAAPGSNPGADLGTDPDTPPIPKGGLAPVNEPTTATTSATAGAPLPTVGPQGGISPSLSAPSLAQQIPTGFNSPGVVPVPVPVGGNQPVNTPATNLLNLPNQPPNPNIQEEAPPVIRQITQPVSGGTSGVCRYEQQRVADIQRKATDTQERASNPTSGFLGLYGLQIEARTKLGQTYDNTQEIKRRIRPEDFPITVPAQIANPNTGIRVIESLAELGVWIVEQLDGVVGKWPMAVPVPGASTALAVPNIAEAMAEMFGMMISQQVTAAQILNTSSRTLAQAGSATQQAALANMISKANAEFLGYESRPTAVDMPLTYTPGHDPGEGLLEESTAKIKGWENTDGTDLKQILSDVLHACQIIKAVYWRRLDAKGDFQQQIDEQIRGKSAWLDELGQRPSPQQADDWEQYLRDVEAGFSPLTDDATPYGRHPDEGPQIRDVTPEPPPPTP